MISKSIKLALPSIAALALAVPAAWAKVSPEEVAKLGKELTCVGAEKAGNKDGSVPTWTGKWFGVPQGVNFKGSGTAYPDPFVGEKSLFEITAKNVDQYAAHLSDGEKALLKKYPATFRMPVYPSHRDFAYDDWVCEVIKKNAAHAELQDEGYKVNAAASAMPFPIPKSGLELLWNHLLAKNPWKENAVYDQAVVYPGGNIAWGRVLTKYLSVANEPNPKGDKSTKGVQNYFYQGVMLPERNKGEIITGEELFDHRGNARQAYQYNPGTRRVRQLPSFGYDMPSGPGGFRTVDDDHLFNGSPERYNWKILGKKEVYIPYDSYRLDDPKIKYSELLKPGHANPDYMRYELHRVWVLEAKLKEGFRHQYAKRVFYLDEDTWQAVAADNYDARGQLWRVGLVNTLYAYDIHAFQTRATFYHDLISGAYLADRLLNEQKHAAYLGAAVKNLSPDDFTPEAASRAGH